jgi:hypothetical protein
MKNFLDNWDYKKHAAAVTAFYLGTAIVGNAILGEKDASCCSMTKNQRIFNGMMAGFYAFDMSGTYLILDSFRKKNR